MAIGGARGKTRRGFQLAGGADIHDEPLSAAGKLKGERACVRAFGIRERRRPADIEQGAQSAGFQALKCRMGGVLHIARLAAGARQRCVDGSRRSLGAAVKAA